MLSDPRDLMDHAEWANAVFFHAWGISPPGIMRRCAGGSVTSSASSKDSCRSCEERRPAAPPAARPIPSRP